MVSRGAPGGEERAGPRRAHGGGASLSKDTAASCRRGLGSRV